MPLTLSASSHISFRFRPRVSSQTSFVAVIGFFGFQFPNSVYLRVCQLYSKSQLSKTLSTIRIETVDVDEWLGVAFFMPEESE